MPTRLEHTVTIVNNSGKVIKTGKQLYSIFKDITADSYKQKKDEIKSSRGLQRAQTFDTQSQHSHQSHQPQQAPQPQRRYPPIANRGYYEDEDRYQMDRSSRRRSVDGGSDTGSRRSHRSRSVASSRRYRDDRDADTRSQYALTERNLKTHSEVSATAPSKMPSRPAQEMALTHRPSMPMTRAPSVGHSVGPPATVVPRSHSETALAQAYKPQKKIDMDLAYGSVPPDLETRYDLDPRLDVREEHAKSLVGRVEGLLDEAKCVQHSASATITHLQKDPDAAAAVALGLADLSSMITKLSPAFIGLLKGSSPTIFALLASPQFLIGTSIAAGLTVVCFGGWKIVKRMREDDAAARAIQYDETASMDQAPPPMTRAPTEYSTGIDEALIVEDDISSIETWRRGIAPYGDDESADLELITPRADRATRDQYDDDTRSRRSARTSRSHQSDHSHRSHRSHRSSRHHGDRDESDRHSRYDTESIADSERSHRSRRSERSHRSDDIRSRRGDEEPVMRPKAPSNNMLKALFKKDKKERSLVMA